MLLRQNLPPHVLSTIANLQPRYIMNLAFRPKSETWFIFFYGRRTAYDAKWLPKKPNDSVGEILDVLREEAKDQVSSCAFGEDHETWFMRSTDPLTEWYPQLGTKVPPKLSVTFHKAIQDVETKERVNGEKVGHTKLRAVTFGHRGAWILYGKDGFDWSKEGLPQALVQALELGKRKRVEKAIDEHKDSWTINVGEPLDSAAIC
jgi:hypothetical protein